MDNYHKKNSNDLTIESIKISYEGVDTQEKAWSLHSELCKKLQLKINPPTEIPSRIAGLGVSDILITIIHGVITHEVWHNIRMPLLRIIQRVLKGMRGQIIVRGDDCNPGRSFPFEKDTIWEKLLDHIEKYINERKRKSLMELIEERLKIDEEITQLFKRELTFLTVGVVSSEKLWKEEPDLPKSIYSFEQYYKYVKGTVEENKGKVLNAIEGEITACFETPYDAINCSLAIFSNRNNFNKIKNKLKNEFQFRIGINSGLAFVDNSEDKVFSKEILPLARRLQEEAEPGTFLISENTYSKLTNNANLQKHKYIERDKIWSYIFSEIIDNKQTRQ